MITLGDFEPQSSTEPAFLWTMGDAILPICSLPLNRLFSWSRNGHIDEIIKCWASYLIWVYINVHQVNLTGNHFRVHLFKAVILIVYIKVIILFQTTCCEVQSQNLEDCLHCLPTCSVISLLCWSGSMISDLTAVSFLFINGDRLSPFP